MVNHDYHRRPEVGARIVEFLGGTRPENASAVYVTASGRGAPDYTPRPADRLHEYLDRGLDIGRSLWDRRALIIHFDIDYVNFTFPAEPFLNPERTFDFQTPIVDEVGRQLRGCGIEPLHLLSGCGHHFIWRVDQSSIAFSRLERIGRIPDSLADRYAQDEGPQGETVGRSLGRAFAAVGMVLEFLAHRVIAGAGQRCAIPVTVTAVRTSEGQRGDEAVALDTTEYADPVHCRSIRVPFSVYLKPHQQSGMFGRQAVRDVGPLFLIPVNGIDLDEGLEIMRDPDRTGDLARRSDVTIPDQSQFTLKLLDAYEGSSLAEFHDRFYAQAPHEPDRWGETYDRFDPQELPPCGARVLNEPNDLLLKPDCIRHVVRLLLARGWAPRHIAGLIRSRYERDFGWQGYWFRYDAASRADFYTRVFAGAVWTGLDDLEDLDCRTCRVRGYCHGSDCREPLDRSRETLKQWRNCHV